MDEHELAWAAGFFDGDGWASLVRDRRRGTEPMRPQAQINQGGVAGTPYVLARFKQAVGVGHVGGPRRKPGRQDLYWWASSCKEDVARTGTLIGPWLSLEKRLQFSESVGLTFRGSPKPSRAWAAGLFDAEGSVSLSNHRTHRGYKLIEASVTQGSSSGTPEELLRYLDVVGLGAIYGPYRQEGANELVYRWRLGPIDAIREMLHVLQPWLGDVKRQQAFNALQVIDDQALLPRGRADWGSHKTHCVHGHEYQSARLRPYVSRGAGVERRANKQCLACAREQARAKRLKANRWNGSSAAG